MHWRAQCHAKWPRGCKEFQHPARMEVIEPKSPDTLETASITEPWVHINLPKKTLNDLLYQRQCISQPGSWNLLFACRIVVLRLLRLIIKARHDIPEFLYANLWSIHVFAFEIDWSWNIFTSHNFQVLLNAHRVAHRPQKRENWGLEI